MTDIFITFKNTYNGKRTIDAEIAEKIYNKLIKMKFNVFMMNDTLKSFGVSNYKKKIDTALNEASCLIVVSSQKEFLEYEWVRYEWDTFLSEVLAGRKVDNIFTYRIGDFSIADLPIGLRKYQSFGQEEEEMLYMFIDNALSPSSQPEQINDVKRFVYPIVISKKENEEGYNAYYPDIGLKCDGIVIEEAFLYAEEFLKQYFIYVLKYDFTYNKPSDFETIKAKYPNDIVMLIDVGVTSKMINSAPPMQNNDEDA